MIVAPDGSVLSSAGDGVEEPSARIDPGLLEQVRSRFTSVGKTPHSFYDSTKVIEEEALGEKLSRSQGIGRTIVFTNGCFDILHTGHVTYLEQARKKGDCLVVGLNSDASIKSIKGPDRPINSEESRARILAALGCVDFVVLFDEDTPHRLITTLMPDVLVKGADWEIENIVGAKEVLAAGGRVETIAFVENHSTTSLIEKIRE
ncbi:MAG: D-glycero-beta-D-manno-heptose 1-phosphate adenylyltransferase [Desulfobulbaceae bacterium]|nr:D-glycero-beta-D-manno-heptose 1-phosphate adenylyltransferase [Desulfobulbaceae bacterium]